MVLMHDFLFVASFLGVSFILGFSITRKLTNVPAIQCLAPIIGFAVIAFGSTLLYRYGVTAPLITFVVLAATAISFALSYPQLSTLLRRQNLPYALAITIMILLALSPKWTGGENFYAFQMNPYDQINYFHLSSAVRNLQFDEIVHPSSPNWGILANGNNLTTAQFEARPAVIITHAVLTWPFFSTTIEGYYPFMAALQVLMALAVTFLISHLKEISLWPAALLALGFAFGPLYQHVIDLNAWSQSAALPVAFATLPLGIILLITPSQNGWLLAAFTACLTGVIYLYPEILPVCFTGGAAATLAYLSKARHLRSLGYPAIGTTIAIACAALYWKGTLGFGLSQSVNATQSLIGWALYYDGQLLGRDIVYPSISQMQWGRDLFYSAASLPVDLAVGALGLFYLLPTPDWPFYVRALWKLAAAGCVIVLAAAVFASLKTLDRKGRLLSYGLIGCLAVPAVALAANLYWTAGKALSMASPALYVLATLPLFTGDRPTWMKLPSALVVGIAFWFAIARPVGAANPSGFPFPPPYPFFKTKPQTDWTISSHRQRLQQCNGVHLDIDNVFLDSYLQIALTDWGIRWTSLRPIRPNHGLWPALEIQPRQSADCLLSDSADTTRTSEYSTVVNFKR